MRVIYMGTPDFAVDALEAIFNEGHEVVAVVTQADKPKGRGKEVSYTPVKESAIKLGIKVFQPIKIKEDEFVKVLEELKPEVIVVAAYGQILSERILNIPMYGCINIHASLLPKYRGAAPIQWSIINGEKYTGITTMYMEKGLDTGDMLEKTEIEIDEDETGGSLHDKLKKAGAKLIISTLEKLKNNQLTPIKQDDSLSSYASMLDKKMGLIDFSNDAASIERLIRGLNPWPSAYTYIFGKTLKIWKAKVTQEKVAKDCVCGQIVEVSKDTIKVSTKDYLLEILELQLEGKKRLTTEEFLRGVSVKVGLVLPQNLN